MKGRGVTAFPAEESVCQRVDLGPWGMKQGERLNLIGCDGSGDCHCIPEENQKVIIRGHKQVISLQSRTEGFFGKMEVQEGAEVRGREHRLDSR